MWVKAKYLRKLKDTGNQAEFMYDLLLGVDKLPKSHDYRWDESISGIPVALGSFLFLNYSVSKYFFSLMKPQQRPLFLQGTAPSLCPSHDRLPS